MTLSRVLLLLWVGLSPGYSSRILAVLPAPSRSHFGVFQPLLLALASRGHDLTVVSSFPLSAPRENYTDIDIRGFKNVYTDAVGFEIFQDISMPFHVSLAEFYKEVKDFELVFSHPEVRRLLASEEEFDLVLTEFWVTDVFLGFAHKFHAPVVGLSSCRVYPWHNDNFDNPDNPSYIPTNFLATVPPLHFWTRLYNAYQLLASKTAFHFWHDALSGEIARRQFGHSLPALQHLALDTAVLLVNSHHTLHGPRPLSPRMVEVGGIHVTEPQPLPEVKKEFV